MRRDPSFVAMQIARASSPEFGDTIARRSGVENAMAERAHRGHDAHAPAA